MMKINWMDMIVKDPDKVSSFYSEVVGLKREPVPEDETHTSYSLHDESGAEVLGIVDEAMFPNWVQGWLPYIDIQNFDDRVARVQACGGELLRQMTMNYNWPGQRFCLVRDPSGAPMMLCEAKPEAP